VKKILCFVLTLIIVLELSGCSNTEPMDIRLDELELQIEKLQTELDAKDELLDSMTENIVNLNKNIHDDTTVLELIASLQLQQDNYVNNNNVLRQLIASLQLWQDKNAPIEPLDNIDISKYVLLYEEGEFQIYILEVIPDAQFNVGIIVQDLDSFINEICVLEITTTNAHIVRYNEEYISLRSGVRLGLFDTYDLMEYGVQFTCWDFD